MSKRERVYVRFVCFQVTGRRKHRLGLFQALDAARESEFAAGWALKEIGLLYEWFKENLKVPPRFSKGGGKEGPGLSWFKPQASEHIAMMHRLAVALKECGVHVEVLTTRDPGFIIYQDEHQVVADPEHRKF